MNLAERQRQFAEAATKHFGATKLTKLSRLFGVSNSAKIIEGGIQIGVPNLVTAGSQTDAFILACFRSFAASLHHALVEAESSAARG